MPETGYACWRSIRFDNARAHLAADSLDVACEILGCTVDVGPVYQPDDRPFIERFFGTVARQLAHRLPGTTGSKPTDALRELRKPAGAADDIRVLRAFRSDGTELGELTAGGVWRLSLHSLDMRQRIFKARRLREIELGDHADPVDVYLQFKRKHAKGSRKAASEIARIKERLSRSAPAATTDASSNEAAALPLAVGPAQPHRLRIRSGFA